MSWQRRPFEAIRQELSRDDDPSPGANVRSDPERAIRTGVPEFVLAGSKDTTDVVTALDRLATANGRATATRCRADQVVDIPARLSADFDIELQADARAITVSTPGSVRPVTGGRVGIITAGSSDIPTAAEAALIARELGCTVYEVRDVGVAGLHRLVRPLEHLADQNVHVIIVAAGMDGALPSVVSGLVPVPVIGLPTPVGYGHGGEGHSALGTMLQSCAPGLLVVNIDNGLGAGAAAAKIANMVARAESRSIASE